MTSTAEELTPRPSLQLAPQEPDAPLGAGEPYVVTSAETAQCSCPDACERDHDNE